MPIVFTKFYNMLNDIANKLREKGITKAGNKDEFEKQRVARAIEIINNFAQSIRKTVKNAQFFIYNPRSPTEKAYNYRFTYEEEDTVQVELLAENTPNSHKLIDITPVESFLVDMVNIIVPQFHQIQLYSYAKDFCTEHCSDKFMEHKDQKKLDEACSKIYDEIEKFERDAKQSSMEHIQRVVPQIIIPKISELASSFIRENEKTSYLLANTFHKQLTDTVYNGMKK